MNQSTLDQFIKYYREYEYNGHFGIVSHMYEKFGREFIHELPTEYITTRSDSRITVIRGTFWIHSTTEPVFYYQGKPMFYILDHRMFMDRWLLRSALLPEEHLIYKLKYG